MHDPADPRPYGQPLCERELKTHWPGLHARVFRAGNACPPPVDGHFTVLHNDHAPFVFDWPPGQTRADAGGRFLYQVWEVLHGEKERQKAAAAGDAGSTGRATFKGKVSGIG